MSYASTVLQRKFGLGQQYDPDALKYFSTAGISSGAVTPSAYDQAATFNGTNQYLSVASNSSLQLNGKDFTISCWVNTKAANSTQVLVSKASGSIPYDYEIYIQSSKIGFDTYGTGISSNTTINSFQWYHVVITFASGATKLYINGNLDATATCNSPTNTNTAFCIGAYSTTSFPVNGSMAGAGIWTSASGGGGALSASQVSALYNKGIGLTYSVIEITDLEPNLVSYWALNETSGASVYVDSNEINNLTPYNTPTNSVGPIATSTLPTQNLINSFVKGIKNLGLWNNFVCWPIRSSQNNQSSNTQLSLGGLGSYPLVLANSPAISSAGMIFNGTNQYAKCSQSGSQLNASLFANAGQIIMFSPLSSTRAFSMFFGQENGATYQYGMMRELNTFGTIQTTYESSSGNVSINNATSLNFNAWNVAYNSVSPVLGSLSVNNSSPLTATLIGYPIDQGNVGDYVGFAAREQAIGGTYFASMTASFGAFIGNVTPSSTQMGNIYSLYKSTLGVGLSLP